MSTETPPTKRQAYQDVKDAGEDVSLRRHVAAKLREQPDTTSGLVDRFPEHSSNAIRPRVNELLRMGCVERDGKRENPSGHEAYVHHITEKGERYLTGDVDPDPGATVAEQAKRVVAVARNVVAGNADSDDLEAAVREHDQTKARLDPDFTSDLLKTMNTQADTDSDDRSVAQHIHDVVRKGRHSKADVIDTVADRTDSDPETVETMFDDLQANGFVYVTDQGVKLP